MINKRRHRENKMSKPKTFRKCNWKWPRFLIADQNLKTGLKKPLGTQVQKDAFSFCIS